MSFRVTPNTFSNNAVSSIAARNARLADLQKQATSGLRVTKPSDDPRIMRSLMRYDAVDERYNAQLDTLADVRIVLGRSENELRGVNNIFIQAEQIVISANQPEAAGERQAFANEVNSLLESLVSRSTSMIDGRYVFGGSATNQEPYSVERTADGLIRNVKYVGSTTAVDVIVEPRTVIRTFRSGTDVFGGAERAETLIGGNTGVATGTGTNTGTGVGTINIEHTTTSYAAGSGIQPGLSSVLSDTVIGNSLFVTMNDTSGNGTAGTISLNGGPEVQFTNSDTDLKLVDSRGRVAFVDTSSVTPGFGGQIGLVADGTVSVDGGNSKFAIAFVQDQAVTNSLDGTVAFLDTRNVGTTGSDTIEFVGTADAFGTLIQLRDDLLNVRGLPEGEWYEAITRRLEDLNRVRNSNLNTIAENASNLERLDSVEFKLNDMQLETKRLISELQGADIATVAIELQNERNLLEFTLAISANLMETTLLDFLR